MKNRAHGAAVVQLGINVNYAINVLRVSCSAALDLRWIHHRARWEMSVATPRNSGPDPSSQDTVRDNRTGAFCKRCGGALEHMYTFQKASDRSPFEIFTFEIFQCVVCKHVVWSSDPKGFKS
jgi:hypothetical protein